MVKIKIVKKQSSIISFSTKGHANAGTEGNDLVCAGCSCIITGLANAIDEMCGNNVQIMLDENQAEFIVKEDNETVQDILNTGRIQLMTIAESYPKNVSIEITED